jgi:hypothetical protein
MLLTEMRRQVQLLVRQDYVGAETGRERRWRERGESERARFRSHVIGCHGSILGGLSLAGHPLCR